MKKIFSFLGISILGLTLVSCEKGKNIVSSIASDSVNISFTTSTSPSNSTPPSSSFIVPPSVVPPSTGPLDEMTPDGRFQKYSQAVVGEYTYFLGTLIKMEKFSYSANVNAYFLDGKYGYAAINVDSTGLNLGENYMITGLKKNSPSYGYRIDASGESVVPMKDMSDLYGMVEPIYQSVKDITNLSNYPLPVKVNEMILKNKDNIKVTGSFDKQSFVATIGNTDVTVEALKSSIGGEELIEYIYNTPLGTKFSIDNLIVFSPALAKVMNLEDFHLEGDADQMLETVAKLLTIPSSTSNDLVLPSEKLGVKIIWSSSNENAISPSGKITRPQFGSPDITVQLTANLSYQGKTKSIVFSLQVLALDIDVSKLVDPIISVYMEGSGSNKIIGIYNPTMGSIEMNNYYIEMYPNGSSTASAKKKFDYTLAPQKTLFIYNSLGTIISDAGNRSNFIADNTLMNFNGDDAIVLRKDNLILDIIGKIGEKPSSGWIVDGLITTKDHTLIRSSSVLEGTSVFDPTEWRGFDCDNVDFLN